MGEYMSVKNGIVHNTLMLRAKTIHSKNELIHEHNFIRIANKSFFND